MADWKLTKIIQGNPWQIDLQTRVIRGVDYVDCVDELIMLRDQIETGKGKRITRGKKCAIINRAVFEIQQMRKAKEPYEQIISERLREADMYKYRLRELEIENDKLRGRCRTGTQDD